MDTSSTELKDIIKAWLAISIAFAVTLSESIFTSDFYIKFIIASLTVGIGFVLHELAHKITAQRYGCHAEFKSFDNMLLLAIVTSFFGFILAAPGAVMISGRVNKKKNGVISAAGPIVNLILASIFLALIFIQTTKSLKEVFYLGYIINSWLALFNMIPLWFFDGRKILKWNKLIYASITSLAFMFILVKDFI